MAKTAVAKGIAQSCFYPLNMRHTLPCVVVKKKHYKNFPFTTLYFLNTP